MTRLILIALVLCFLVIIFSQLLIPGGSPEVSCTAARNYQRSLLREAARTGDPVVMTRAAVEPEVCE